MRPSRTRQGPAIGLLLLCLCLCLCPWAVRADQAPVSFFAVGDLPYSDAEKAPLAELLREASARGPDFLVHVGDIKQGSTPCSDQNLAEMAALFRAQPVPVVYTIGDNEWTDCHRAAAGGHDPLARLARVRSAFFDDGAVLRLAALGVNTPDAAYPENGLWMQSGVLFVAMHLVGSNNGLVSDAPRLEAEFAARAAANRSLLERATALAEARKAGAMVLIFHANPLFEDNPGPRGFRPFKRDLAALLARFPGPVLALHGDTHNYQQDQPVEDPATGEPLARLVRVEIPGSPIVGGVWIRVDPSAPEPFLVEPVYPVSRDAIEAP